MGNLFARRRPEPKVSEQDQAILQLKTQRDRIRQYMKRNEKQMDRERELAKELIRAGKKDRALLLLKRKRYKESVIERVSKQLDQIDRMVHELEFAEIEKRVIEGLKNGNEALKQMNMMLSAEDVEKILEETQEAAEYQQEITNLLSGKLSENDLEEVELELESIIEQELSKELDHLPEVPSEEPVAADDKELLKDDAVANNKQQKMRSDRAEKVMVEAS